jgi:hypothetical protein
MTLTAWQYSSARIQNWNELEAKNNTALQVCTLSSQSIYSFFVPKCQERFPSPFPYSARWLLPLSQHNNSSEPSSLVLAVGCLPSFSMTHTDGWGGRVISLDRHTREKTGPIKSCGYLLPAQHSIRYLSSLFLSLITTVQQFRDHPFRQPLWKTTCFSAYTQPIWTNKVYRSICSSRPFICL